VGCCSKNATGLAQRKSRVYVVEERWCLTALVVGCWKNAVVEVEAGVDEVGREAGEVVHEVAENVVVR